MGQLAGKIAVITGGNSGIGLATAKRFAAEGAEVIITGRRQAELDNAVKEIGGTAIGFCGDVSSLDDLDRLFALVKKQKGRLDILFANAGSGEFAALPDITEAHFSKTFDVNVKGTLFTVQKALPLMSAGGSIVLTGSTTASEGTPSFSVYAATKAAIRSFARNWILDIKGSGIRINVLTPGATSTPGLHGLATNSEEDKAFTEFLAGRTTVGRIGQPEEIAAGALFLASDESSYVNGIELFVDGGSAQI
ncbi:SDR family NAD(P)-dependent oxidoreductase [Pararhizobium sp. DWP3-4]|uniref:SDR family NAD(P)-dependent oxidoreductase n=1 Tax=Pararhizobium sp. DWP3-4 TaxID=2804565 RepID=UPI003CE8B81F